MPDLAAALRDLVSANHILAHEGVVDAYGHVSMRHPERPDRFFLAAGPALTGAGQVIGLYGLNYNIADVEKYYNAVGQAFNPSQVQNFSTDGTQNSCGAGCDDGEPVIDIIAALSMAPGATIVVPRDPQPFNLTTFLGNYTDILSKIAITAASLAVLEKN